jgi:Bacterial regulatory protein, Fis family
MLPMERIAQLLIADDPKQKADRILTHAIADYDGAGGAVLAIHDGRLEAFALQRADLDRLLTMRKRWSSFQSDFAKGRCAWDGENVIAPIHEGPELVGALWIERPRAFDEADSQIPRTLLAKTLTVAATIPAQLAGSPKTFSLVDETKARMLDELRRYDWNIAQVARVLGVTRRTIYLRLKKYGINRKKMPKTIARTVPA